MEFKLKAHEMEDPRRIETHLEKLAHEANRAEEEFVIAEEEFKVLHDIKDAVFDTITMHYSEEKYIKQQEQKARQDPKWKEWLKDYQQKRFACAQAKAKKGSTARLWETAKHILYSRNAERRTIT